VRVTLGEGIKEERRLEWSGRDLVGMFDRSVQYSTRMPQINLERGSSLLPLFSRIACLSVLLSCTNAV
jgi:hypothetical protein